MKRMQGIGTFVLISIWMLLEGCGGGGNGDGLGPMPEPNPIPTVTSVSPNSVAAGAPDTSVTISGSGLISSSTVNLNGQALKTTFISATQLTAVIPAGNLAAGDNALVDHTFGHAVLLTDGTVLLVGSLFTPLHADIYKVGP